MHRLSFLSLVSLLTSSCSAWGALGHETVGLIAQAFVTSKTQSWAQGLIGNTSSTYLADISTWADSYRSTTAGKFSAPYHYIDAEDSPPSSCNVDLNRDCGAAGCVIAAIANYTARVRDTKQSKTERLNALKFIVHFLGDVHQPLHDEALKVGGNKINVTFAAKKTNLHSIWDTAIPEKIVGGGSLSSAQSWASSLTSQIKSGMYASASDSWLSGMGLDDATGSAMVWARDSNAFVCSAVMPGGEEALSTGDLSGDYYKSVTATVELQIAKAGYRLGAWLNLIATGSTGGLKVKKDVVKREPLSYLINSYMNEFSRAKLARRAFGDLCHDHEH